jgi:hypothetical protein
MNQPLKVGIIGDFDPNNFTHLATHEALSHAAKALAMTCRAYLAANPLSG